MKALTLVACMLLVVGCGGPAEPGAPTGADSGDSGAAAAANAERTEPKAPAPTAGAEPTPLKSDSIDVPLLEQELAYGEAEGANLTGYLAMPRDAIEPPPGLLVIHEWWGLNDEIRAMTRRLAAEGYVALAVDLYGDAVAEDASRAQALQSQVVASQDAVRSNLRQAHEWLSQYALSPRTGAIGWGLGGGWAMQTALMLPDELDAFVMYYGRIETNEDRLRALSTPMLGLFGEHDESIPARDVRVYRSKLKEMKKNVDIFIYPDAGHAFAIPGRAGYDPEVAADAWDRTIAFLDRYLK